MNTRIKFWIIVMFAFGVVVLNVQTARADLEPTGLAKPVADLRDWNGTYTGAVGTGTKNYSTLYRDNYGTGTCHGEGCGSHPGVDIRVGSNTNVYASQGGVVFDRRCSWNGVRNPNTSTGWGGLIVIKSPHPYIPGREVYYSYAHLNDWDDFPVGATVSTGQLIGKSGGDINNGVCPGASTGAHLHFQIDSDFEPHTIPYFPSNVGTADSNFQVTRFTYNPIPFVTGGYRWAFNNAGDYEYWTVINLESSGVSGSALWVDGAGDSYIQRRDNVPCGRSRPCSSKIAAETSVYKRVHLNMFNHCYSNPLKVYFTTSTNPNWNEYQSESVWLPNWGANDIHVDMSRNPYWTGVVKEIRIDSAEYCTPGAFDPNYFGNITVER